MNVIDDVTCVIACAIAISILCTLMVDGSQSTRHL